MKLLLVVALALLVAQFLPVSCRHCVDQGWRQLLTWVTAFNDDVDGGRSVLAWCSLVLPPVVVLLLFSLALDKDGLLVNLLSIVVLSLCFDFRAQQCWFNDIQQALRKDNCEQAQQLLRAWRSENHDGASEGEIARLSIEQFLPSMHRCVFGILFWLVLLPGASGAVLYRLSALVWEGWQQCDPEENADKIAFAQRIFMLLDWLPQRLTAFVLSIVGNFEEALYCWRAQAVLWRDRSVAVLLAAAAGALGVRLGMAVHVAGQLQQRPELGTGEAASVGDMQLAINLLWRALFAYLLLLVLV